MTTPASTSSKDRTHTLCAMITAACAVLMMTGATYDFLTAETFPIWTLCGAGLVIACRDFGHWLIRRHQKTATPYNEATA